MYLPTVHTPPIQWFFLCLSAPTIKMIDSDNASVKLLSVLIDIISSEIVMQPNLKWFCWRNVVFKLTAVAVVPSFFRVLKLVTLKCWIDHGFSYVKSPVLHAILAAQARSKRVCIAFVVVLYW
jgi:hypothetical protein